MNPHEKWLRQVSEGLHRAGLHNYGNTVDQAADEIRRLQNAWEGELKPRRKRRTREQVVADMMQGVVTDKALPARSES